MLSAGLKEGVSTAGIELNDLKCVTMTLFSLFTIDSLSWMNCIKVQIGNKYEVRRYRKKLAWFDWRVTGTKHVKYDFLACLFSFKTAHSGLAGGWGYVENRFA